MSGKLDCTDLDLEPHHQNYQREIHGGNIVTNESDFAEGLRETENLIEALKQCQAKLL